MSLFDKTMRTLDTSLDMRQIRQNVISGNIANAETPGYKAKKMDFEEALSRAANIDGRLHLGTSSPEHFPVGQGPLSRVRADVYDDPEGQVNNDLNTVDMEKEMTQLAENSVLYRAAVQLINKKLAALRYAATEGGR